MLTVGEAIPAPTMSSDAYAGDQYALLPSESLHHGEAKHCRQAELAASRINIYSAPHDIPNLWNLLPTRR